MGEEGGHLGSRMGGVVVCELGVAQEASPVVLANVDEVTDVGAEDLVHSLGLSVGLGVVGCADQGGDSEDSDEGSPELGSVERASVGDDVLGQTKPAYHIAVKYVGEGCSREAFLGVGDENCHLGESIDEDVDAVVAV